MAVAACVPLQAAAVLRLSSERGAGARGRRRARENAAVLGLFSNSEFSRLALRCQPCIRCMGAARTARAGRRARACACMHRTCGAARRGRRAGSAQSLRLLMSLALMICAGGAVAAAPSRPCDIYAAHGSPCAAAHAVTRALFANYSGPLYQLKRFSDNQTLDIHPLAAGGIADAVAHDTFCGNTRPSPSPAPSPAPHGLPALGTAVRLEPVAMYGFVFRHCYNQGFLTPTYDTHGSSNDHIFKLVSALSGTPNAFSFESTNFPGMYIAPMPGDDHRPGIVKSPAPLDASWKVTPATDGKGVTLTSLSPTLAAKYSRGESPGLAIGTNLSGTCAHSYDPPSKNAAIAPHPSAWYITRDTGGGPGSGYPARAECVINIIYDQSGNGNHMLPATPAVNDPAYDNPVNATRHPVRIGGVKAYGA